MRDTQNNGKTHKMSKCCWLNFRVNDVVQVISAETSIPIPDCVLVFVLWAALFSGKTFATLALANDLKLFLLFSSLTSFPGA